MNMARAGRQMTLLPVMPHFTILGNAQARNAYGAAAQEIACAALGLDPIAIDGSKAFCPDAEREDDFYEIKSVHQHAKIVMYDWRIKKEAGAGVPLFYVLVVHRVRRARTSTDMWRAFMEKGLELIVVNAASIHELALLEPLRQLIKPTTHSRNGNGYNRKGYKEGYYNLPVQKVRSLATEKHYHVFEFYGNLLPIRIFIQPRHL